jgi:hypothetical protein
MQSRIRQTIFQAEPLKNVVGVGNTTAYHVVVTPGASLGFLGRVTVPAYAEICNDPIFARNPANESGSNRPASRFRRALATLNF